MSSEFFIDALPYFDQGYNEPGVREAALALVEEEMRRYRPAKNYLDYLPSSQSEIFETPLIKAELNRIQSRTSMEMLSMKRYELPQPTVGRLNDVNAWQESVDNSEAQNMCQDLRLLNLNMMIQYDPEAWKQSLDLTSKMIQQTEKKLIEEKKATQETNWHRKNEQLDAGSNLSLAEETWVGLVSRNYELEQVLQELSKEVESLEMELNETN